MSTSMLYELIEWAAAAMFGGDLGQAYLGTQGDVWDAHKDMAFASLGALIAMLITAGENIRVARRLAREGKGKPRGENNPPPWGKEECRPRLRGQKNSKSTAPQKH